MRAVVAMLTACGVFAGLLVREPRSGSPGADEVASIEWRARLALSSTVHLVGDLVIVVEPVGSSGRVTYAYDLGAAAGSADVWRRPGWVEPVETLDGTLLVTRYETGFSLVDPQTGLARWTNLDADEVDEFGGVLIWNSCDEETGAGMCALSGLRLADRAGEEVRRGLRPDWTIPVEADWSLDWPLEGVWRAPGTRFESLRAEPAPGGTPVLLPLRQDDRFEVVDPATGRVVFGPAVESPWERILVLGRSVVRIATRWDGVRCGYEVTATSLDETAVSWSRNDLDLGTAGGTGCQQTVRIVAAAGVLWARVGGRPVLLDTAAGRERWVGQPDERVVALSRSYAIVATPAGRLRLVGLFTGHVQAELPGTVDELSAVAVVAGGVIVESGNGIWRCDLQCSRVFTGGWLLATDSSRAAVQWEHDVVVVPV